MAGSVARDDLLLGGTSTWQRGTQLLLLEKARISNDYPQDLITS